MENKYYTPELEEFHIGLEYEQTDDFKKWYKKKTDGFDFSSFKVMLNKSVLGALYTTSKSEAEYGFLALNSETYEKVKKVTKLSRIRIKYLDKEDISEVLSRPQLKGDEVELNFQVLLDDSEDFYEIYYDTETKELVVEKFVETKEFTYNTFPVFRGKIKNKTEFKKLTIEQLEIPL